MMDVWESLRERASGRDCPPVFLIRGSVESPRFPDCKLREMEIAQGGGDSPIAPLLAWIVDEWASLPSEERGNFLSKARFYSPHKRMFTIWALEGRAQNPDEVLFSESNQRYERQAWFDSLARLFCLLCARERGQALSFFLIRRAQHASQGLIAFLLALIASGNKAPCLIILEADGARSWAGPPHLDQWQAFTKALDEADALYRSGTGSPAGGSRAQGDIYRPKALPRAMEAQRLLFCAEDALRVLDALPEEGTGEWDLLRLICCECWASIGDFGRAGLLIEPVISRLKEASHLYRAYLLACRICGWKRSEEAALRALSLAWEQARLMDDPMAAIHCRVHEVFVQEMFGSRPDLIELAELLAEELKAYRLHNIIGYLDTLVIHYDWIVRARGWEAAFEKATVTLARYKRLGNRYRQSILLHVLGYLSAQAGHNDEALSHFRAGMRLRKRLGDTSELIKLCNGTGYFCFTIGKLNEALSLYGRALFLMESIGDHQETCLTLFNMAQVFFFTGCFRESSLVLASILDVMEILGYESLPFHRKSKILALAGLSAWHLGKESQALDSLQATERTIVDGDAKPYVDLLSFILTEYDGDLRSQEAAYSDCLKRMEAESLAHLRLHATCATALSLKHRQTDRSEALLTAALAEARERGFKLEEAWISDLLGGTRPETSSRLQIKASTKLLLSRIGSSARQEAMNLRLLDTLGQIQFLQRFQASINVGLPRDKILERSLSLISEQIHPVKVRIRDLDDPLAPEERDFELGFSLGEESLRLEFDLHESTQKALDPGELHILGLALAHLSLILNLKGAQEILEEAARIDPLTGLLNRREIIERLSVEHGRCIRYAKDEITGFAVLFIDLDRFKSYNDRWGHGAGDWILKRFAGLLKEILRGMDVVGRWGGDEFLVLLPDTDLKGAELAAERIIRALKDSGGFAAELSAALGAAIDIPPEHRLGCSIGISSFTPGSHLKADQIIEEADARLYRAKQGGRGRAQS